VNKSPKPDICEQAQDMQVLSRGLDRQTPAAFSQSLNPEHFTMDTQETITRSIDAPDQGNECEQLRTLPYNTEQQGTPVDRATGETVTRMTYNDELEGETNRMERRQSYDNINDENLPKEGHSMASPLTNTSRPNKLKTDCDDPVLCNQNRSKTRIKNPSK